MNTLLVNKYYLITRYDIENSIRLTRNAWYKELASFIRRKYILEKRSKFTIENIKTEYDFIINQVKRQKNATSIFIGDVEFSSNDKFSIPLFDIYFKKEFKEYIKENKNETI